MLVNHENEKQDQLFAYQLVVVNEGPNTRRDEKNVALNSQVVQQNEVIVMNQSSMAVTALPDGDSYASAHVIACFVIWFCCWIPGLISLCN